MVPLDVATGAHIGCDRPDEGPGGCAHPGFSWGQPLTSAMVCPEYPETCLPMRVEPHQGSGQQLLLTCVGLVREGDRCPDLHIALYIRGHVAWVDWRRRSSPPPAQAWGSVGKRVAVCGSHRRHQHHHVDQHGIEDGD